MWPHCAHQPECALPHLPGAHVYRKPLHELRMPPYFRNAAVAPMVSTLEGFHCIYTTVLFALYLHSSVLLIYHTKVNRVLQLLESPYSPPGDTVGADQRTESASVSTPDSYESASMSAYFSKPPEWSLGLCVT